MRTCDNCGESYQNDQKFCKACGHHLPQESSGSINKFTKIIWIGSLIGVLLLGGGFHIFMKNQSNAASIAEKVVESIESNQKETFSDAVELKEEAWQHTTFSSYAAFLKNHGWESVKSSLLQQAENQQAGTVTNGNGQPVFDLQVQNKRFGIYPTYSIEPVPMQLEVTSDIAGVVFHFNGEKYQVKDSDNAVELGSVLPGEQTMSFSYDNDMVEIGEKEMAFTPELIDDQLLHKNVELPLEMISLSSNMDNAELFIDDEPTGLQMGDIEKAGPFLEGESVTLHAETEEGEDYVNRTEKVTYSGQDKIELNFSQVQGLSLQDKDREGLPLKDVKQMVLDFREAYQGAVQTGRFLRTAPYVKEDSEAYKGLTDYIADVASEDYDFHFTSDEVTGVEQVDSSEYQVDTREQFYFTNDQGDTTSYDRQKRYHISLNEHSQPEIYKIDYLDTNRD
ncbi:TcaA NTF2-like domain-containing protein [Salibacterium lacus]|uniref:Zinc ribbon domain-containing protein n=1 Tax=Salibacterium lacus TaxID=1898109 RepID=A0ABW5T4S1_9BACI